MRSFKLFFIVLLLGSACQQPKQPNALVIGDFVEALKGKNIHGIRVENDKKLRDTVFASAAANLYVGDQQFIVLQGTPGRGGETYANFFSGYKAQGYRVIWNKNLVLAAPATNHKDVWEAFELLQ